MKNRALLLIDIQAGFLGKHKKSFLKNLEKLLLKDSYELYVVISFSCDKQSIWYKQTEWYFPNEPVIKEVYDLLDSGNNNIVEIHKHTSSSFKGDKDLNSILLNNNISEVHMVGMDTNDCVLATAKESFDLGFTTYVIKECVVSSCGRKAHKSALYLLKKADLLKSIKNI